MENKKIKVSIFVAGQRFTVITDKSEKYVLDIASEIDARINSLCVSGEMTRERAAVLTALDYADDSRIDKENLAAVKEQIKDYLAQIERLSDDHAKLSSDYQKLREEYERLIADSRSVEETQKQAESDKAQIAELTAEIAELKSQIEALKAQPSAYTGESDTIEEREAPPEKEPVITAEDDLFFDTDEEEPVKPLPQKKKNRHEHQHVNPYKKKAEQKKDNKGYTQQRQYSFFDIDEKKD